MTLYQGLDVGLTCIILAQGFQLFTALIDNHCRYAHNFLTDGKPLVCSGINHSEFQFVAIFFATTCNERLDSRARGSAIACKHDEDFAAGFQHLACKIIFVKV